MVTYVHDMKCIKYVLEGPVGFEPTTRGLKVHCSNLLSYGPMCFGRINSLHYPYFGLKVNRCSIRQAH